MQRLRRTEDENALLSLLEAFPVVGLVGARQVGKTSLARAVAARIAGPVHHFDLEDPDDQRRLSEPKLVLGPLTGLVVLDEIQLQPGLFSLLRVLADRSAAPARFLVLGSASPAHLRQSAETLAGRIAYYELGGFRLDDVGADAWRELWRRGGFPRAFLADDEASARWREQFVRTFLERDLPALGIGVPATTMRRFWSMLAHNQGQLWNAAALARNFGVSEMTVRRYLDHLEGALVVRVLKPWHAQVGKRQVKSPRVYLADSGLLHTLLGLVSHEALLGHPVVGASFEGFVIEQIARELGMPWDTLHFWRTADGAEVDLVWSRDDARVGFEVKLTTAPSVTKSMHVALRDLGLRELFVVHAGTEAWPMGERIEAVPIASLGARIATLKGR